MSIDQGYPLSLTANDSTPITINFTGINPYSSNILYTLVQEPSSANFNSETTIFNWETT